MSVAKFASLHGNLLARKGRATPASGEVNATGDVNAVSKRSFDTAMLTPEPGSHKEKEIPAMIAAAPEVAPKTDGRIQEAIEARLSALAGEPPVDIEQRRFDQGPPLGEPESRAGEPWDDIDRRKADRGLRPGVPERRKPPVFGKRGATKDMGQKRFNA